MGNILTRRQTQFILWCPKTTNRPELIIGQIVNGNPATFKKLNPQTHLLFQQDDNLQVLWQLDAATCGLTDGETYHYWFEVDNSLDNGATRIQVTDPLAYGVDYRLYAPNNPTIEYPAAVIGWGGGKLIASDPNGEKATPLLVPFEKLPQNNQMVIYELPTAWTRTFGSDEFERAVGTFRDVHALVEKNVIGANFPELKVTQPGRQYLVELGVNALEMLPPADSIYSRQWGYGTTHYFAPDYELGYPEGHLSPTPNQDLTSLINSCHQNGIRIFLDVVMGFMKDEPYRHIDFDDFYLENPKEHKDDPDAYTSREGGGKVLRNPFGASCPRYIRTTTTYDPISGDKKEISPARQHMLTFLERWMNDFHIDGIRIDSVENVANWDFIQKFKDEAHLHFSNRYPAAGSTADTKFLVVGEELTLPKELLTQHRLDGLWNENFQKHIRAALIGENSPNLTFEETVRKAIDCRNDNIFTDAAQAINYLTTHDVEGFRKERLYNFMRSNITLVSSEQLFNRTKIEAEVREEFRKEGNDNPTADEVRNRTNETILHKSRLRRIKLGFVCLLTAVGIPMILAGDEFGDQHDLFDAKGNVTHEGGKQVDPVNYSRVDEPDRQELFNYVVRLVKLRTTHTALSVNDTNFIHVDFNEGKRVLVWKRGNDDNPVIVISNFSDYTTPNAPVDSNAEYVVPGWPHSPAGQHWVEVTGDEDRSVPEDKQGKEPIFAWEAKVYRLSADNT